MEAAAPMVQRVAKMMMLQFLWYCKSLGTPSFFASSDNVVVLDVESLHVKWQQVNSGNVE